MNYKVITYNCGCKYIFITDPGKHILITIAELQGCQRMTKKEWFKNTKWPIILILS